MSRITPRFPPVHVGILYHCNGHEILPSDICIDGADVIRKNAKDTTKRNIGEPLVDRGAPNKAYEHLLQPEVKELLCRTRHTPLGSV